MTAYSVTLYLSRCTLFMVYLNGGLRPPNSNTLSFFVLLDVFSKIHFERLLFYKTSTCQIHKSIWCIQMAAFGRRIRNTFVSCSSRHLFKNIFREATILQNVDMSNLQIYMVYLNGGLRPPDTKHFHYCS